MRALSPWPAGAALPVLGNGLHYGTCVQTYRSSYTLMAHMREAGDAAQPWAPPAGMRLLGNDVHMGAVAWRADAALWSFTWTAIVSRVC